MLIVLIGMPCWYYSYHININFVSLLLIPSWALAIDPLWQQCPLLSAVAYRKPSLVKARDVEMIGMLHCDVIRDLLHQAMLASFLMGNS